MGKNNFTHYEGQIVFNCPTDSCHRKYKPSRETGTAVFSCASCHTTFHADIDSGEIRVMNDGS